MVGTLVAGAPLLAGGPPGWAAYGLLALGTLGAVGAAYLIHEATRSEPVAQPTTGTRTGTATSTKTCDRPWSVRIHAQGDVIGGRGGATLGAPAILKPAAPVTVAEGLALSTATFALLSRGQAKTLASAQAQADSWIRARPPAGFLGQKSFYTAERGNNRFDVDSYGCSPNFIG